MKKYAEITEETLVTFHIGRGGMYYNSGFKTFVDLDTPINNYTDDLFVNFENRYDVMKKIEKNSILCKFKDEISDAMSDLDYDKLLQFGITEEELGETYYFSSGGSNTGLVYDNDGTGCIDIDGDYDTTYVCFLKDCDEKEANLILKSRNYVSSDVRDYLEEKFDLKEELIEEE